MLRHIAFSKWAILLIFSTLSALSLQSCGKDKTAATSSVATVTIKGAGN